MLLPLFHQLCLNGTLFLLCFVDVELDFLLFSLHLIGLLVQLLLIPIDDTHQEEVLLLQLVQYFEELYRVKAHEYLLRCVLH